MADTENLKLRDRVGKVEVAVKYQGREIGDLKDDLKDGFKSQAESIKGISDNVVAILATATAKESEGDNARADKTNWIGIITAGATLLGVIYVIFSK